MAGVVADALGRPAPLAVPLSVSAPLLGGVDPGAVRRLDFSAQSDTVDAGAWLDPACEERAAAAALTDGALAAVTAYAEPRLTRSVALHSESSDTVPTGVDLWLAGRTALTAPFAGLVVTAGDGEVILAGENGALVVHGTSVHPAVSAGHAVSGGDALGTVGPGRLWVQVSADVDIAVPAFVRPEYAPGWLTLTHDPAPLLGLPPTATAAEDAADLVHRRGRSFAAVQEQYYRQPPRIERGWREYLLRRRPQLPRHGQQRGGHRARHTRTWPTPSRGSGAGSTPIRGSTTARWWTSRERLAATLPDPLDTVFLVNSGSEAVDLGAAAGDGRHRPAGCGRRARGLPRLDLCHRRGLDVGGRQPERADHAARLGAHRAAARTATAVNTAAPMRPGTLPRPSRSSKRLRRKGIRPRRSSANRSTATRAGSRCPTATWPRCTTRCAPPAGWRSPTRCRSATAGSASGSGDSSGRAWCPTSSRSPRRWATASRSGAVITTRAIADGLPQPGLLLLLGRRQPGLLRRRADGARRHRTGRAAAQRSRRSATTCGRG